MSSIFSSSGNLIAEGDTVIVYYARDNLVALNVTPGKELTSKFGHFSHADMVGVPFGSKFSSKNGKGFTYLLRPTPELWTLALTHRTQILYLPDIAYVTSQLDIKPGSVVVEAGTGSGSFSHSVARTIGPKGKLLSFEFHEERYKSARAEFESHGLLAPTDGPITLEHRNVVKDGLGDIPKVDAVFFDLPAPWDVLEDAKRVMNRKALSRICCFSPCIEQVQRTVTTLTALGFSDIVMYEALTRTHEPATVTMPTIEDAIKRIEEVGVKKEARRERQIKEAKCKKLAKAEEAGRDSESTPAKRTHESDTAENGVEASQPSAKRPRIAGDSNTGSAAVDTSNGDDAYPDSDDKSTPIPTSRPVPMARGHTSFLTFAVLLPDLLEGVAVAPAPSTSEIILDAPNGDASVPPAVGPAVVGVASAQSQPTSTTEDSAYAMAEEDMELIRGISDAELARLSK